MTRFGARVLVWMLLFFAGLAGPASAGGPIVALFEMEDRGSKVDGEILANLIDYLAARLTEGGYQVVPLDQVRERIRSLKSESSKVCYDQNCQIELGRELAAQKTLATKILRIGKSCQVTAVMYDLKRAATETAATEEATCEVDPLLEAVKKIALKLCAPLARAEQKADSNLAAFEALAKTVASEKAEKERMEKAWAIVSAIARDEQVQKKKRIEALKQYLASFPPDGPYCAEAERMLKELQSSALLIKTQPDHAEVFLGREAIGRSPLTQELRPGRYEIAARLPGHREARVTVNLEPEKSGEIILTLEPLPAPPPAPVAPVATVPPAEGANVRAALPERPMPALTLWGHVGVWSGVGCLALGAAGLGMGLKYASDFDGGDLSAEDKARTWTGVMWAGFGLGAALVATGVVLWLLAPGEAPGSGAGVGPTSDGRGLALSFGGRW